MVQQIITLRDMQKYCDELFTGYCDEKPFVIVDVIEVKRPHAKRTG